MTPTPTRPTRPFPLWLSHLSPTAIAELDPRCDIPDRYLHSRGLLAAAIRTAKIPAEGGLASDLETLRLQAFFFRAPARYCAVDAWQLFFARLFSLRLADAHCEPAAAASLLAAICSAMPPCSHPLAPGRSGWLWYCDHPGASGSYPLD